MRILGIDPGLARVGYGIIEATKAKKLMLDCGIISTDPSQKEGDRMVEISKDLRYLIRKWEPKIAAVEKFFFYRSSTTISVVQARGVIMMTLASFGLPVLEFAPMHVKLVVAGSGKADKQDVLQAVMRELNLNTPPKPDDAADALAIAITGLLEKN